MLQVTVLILLGLSVCVFSTPIDPRPKGVQQDGDGKDDRPVPSSILLPPEPQAEEPHVREKRTFKKMFGGDSCSSCGGGGGYGGGGNGGGGYGGGGYPGGGGGYQGGGGGYQGGGGGYPGGGGGNTAIAIAQSSSSSGGGGYGGGNGCNTCH